MLYKPTYVNGSYSIALSTAHGIIPGLYLLTITDATTDPTSSNDMDLVSLSYTIVPAIQTVIPLEANKLLKGTNYHNTTNTNTNNTSLTRDCGG